MNYPRELIESVRQQSLVPFVGAGLSKPSGIPTWLELLDRIIDDIEDTSLREQARTMLSEGRLTTLAAPVLHTVAAVGANYRRFRILRDSFDGPFQPNDYHRALAKLEPGTIVTTNYDRLVELTWQHLGQLVNIVWRDDQLPLYDEKRAVQIIKMHGTVDDSDMVLTASDYDTYAERRPLIYQFVASLFSTRTILFLGCSLTDPNLVSLLEKITQSTRSGGRRHFAVMHDPGREETSRLARYGVEVIALTGPRHEEALVQWLEEMQRRAEDRTDTNVQRAAMFERALKDLVRDGYPGDIVRMRASFGIISNPRPESAVSQIYESPLQDAQELKIGEVTRDFLRKSTRNVIRQIVHIDPLASMDKGYSAEAVVARLAAMLEFIREFPGQIDLAHSPIAIMTNQLISGEREVISAYKYRQVGFTNAALTGNRWVVRREADTFDRDFRAIRKLNESLASHLGIDLGSSHWPEDLSIAIIEGGIRAVRQGEEELVLVDVGQPRLLQRSAARAEGIRQWVIHLHLLTSEAPVRVLLQRRSFRKRQYGGLLDVAVAGHRRSLDARGDAVREAAEELGTWIDPNQLIDLGTFDQTADGEDERVSTFAVVVEGLERLVTAEPASKETSGFVLVPLDTLVDEGSAVGLDSAAVGELRIAAHQVVDEESMVPGLSQRVLAIRAALYEKHLSAS